MLNRTLSAAVFGLLLAGSAAQAAEISYLSGVYRSEENEVADKDAGKETEISAGGRFSDQLDSRMYWFGQARLTLRSYTKGDVGDAPDDSTSLSLGGGVRYYFNKLSETVAPFAYGLGEYRSEKEGETSGGTPVEHEKNGLYYGAYFGIRLSLGADFFVDIETPLFDSALFATETRETETTDAAGKTTKTKDETKRTELYANTTGALNSAVVALGMRL